MEKFLCSIFRFLQCSLFFIINENILKLLPRHYIGERIPKKLPNSLHQNVDLYPVRDDSITCYGWNSARIDLSDFFKVAPTKLTVIITSGSMDDCSTFDIFHVIQQQSPIRDRFFEHPVQMLLPRIVRQDKYNHVPINPRDQMA